MSNLSQEPTNAMDSFKFDEPTTSDRLKPHAAELARLLYPEAASHDMELLCAPDVTVFTGGPLAGQAQIRGERKTLLELVQHRYPTGWEGSVTDFLNVFGEMEPPVSATEGDHPIPMPMAEKAPPAHTSAEAGAGATGNPERPPLAQNTDQAGARLVRRRGWFPVGKSEIALLNEQCGAASASVKAVWLALLCLANDRQSVTFQIEANVICSLAAVCLRTTRTALAKLEELGFVRIERYYDPDTSRNDPSTYTLLRSCNKYTTPSGNDCTTPSGNKRTRGRANEVPRHLHGSEEESAKAFQKKGSGERYKRPDAGALASAAPKLLPHPRPW